MSLWNLNEIFGTKEERRTPLEIVLIKDLHKYYLFSSDIIIEINIYLHQHRFTEFLSVYYLDGHSLPRDTMNSQFDKALDENEQNN